jgi:hypothetical protein
LTGIHEGHDPRWNIRAGLIGGNYCGCAGDCAERAKAAFDKAWSVVYPPTTDAEEANDA